MNARTYGVFAGLGIASLLAFGWARTSGAARAPVASADPAAAAESPQARPFVNPEQSNMVAPLVVTLQDGGLDKATGHRIVNVYLDARGAIRYPLSFEATAPMGSQITLGAPSETLILGDAGRVARVFQLSSDAPLSVDNPFRVVVRGESANHSMGLYANRVLPQPPEVVVQGAKLRPPGGRPPGPIRPAPAAP